MASPSWLDGSHHLMILTSSQNAKETNARSCPPLDGVKRNNQMCFSAPRVCVFVFVFLCLFLVFVTFMFCLFVLNKVQILSCLCISAKMVDLSIADTPAAVDWIRCGRWESSDARGSWPDYPVVVSVCQLYV